MRMTFMGTTVGEPFELIWEDGSLRGPPRLIARLTGGDACASDDPVAFIHHVERVLGFRPHLVVWPEPDRGTDTDPGTDTDRGNDRERTDTEPAR